MAVGERSPNNRRVAVAVVLALGLALAATVVVVSNTSTEHWHSEVLLDAASANSARKASYQGNVGTVYDHLQQIIDKILWHKDAWQKSYKGDLTRVANEVAAAVTVERDASKASDEEAGKAAAAAAKAATKKNAWIAKAAITTAKKADAEEEKKALKALFDKGNAQKGGEVEMIKKIRCMMSKFNKDGKWKCDGTDVEAAGPGLAPGKGLGAGAPPAIITKLNGGDGFLEVGKWRFGNVDGNHFSFSHSSGKTAVIFRSDGTVHPGPRDDFGLWGRAGGKGQMTNVKGGNNFVEFSGKWRLMDMDGGHFSLSHHSGKTAMIWRSDGTSHPGPRSDFSDWSREGASNLVSGDRYFKIGSWRVGDVDGAHMSIGQDTTRKTAVIYRSDGTIHPGPRDDFNVFDRP